MENILLFAEVDRNYNSYDKKKENPGEWEKDIGKNDIEKDERWDTVVFEFVFFVAQRENEMK